MKEYLAYTTKNLKDNLVILIAGIVFIIAGTIVLKQSKITGIVLIILGFILLLSLALQKRNNQTSLTKMEGRMEEVLNDFKQAQIISEDDARIGDIYIFRKKYNDPLLISEIIQADYSEKINSDNSGNDAGIYLKLTNGKEEKLCGIYGPDKKKQGNSIIQLLKEKNKEIS